MQARVKFMLNTFDMIIAFAVIMTVLSLLITIIVQMVSAALSLRGKNLANALALTFQTIDPKLEEQAQSLANQILRDPIFSDSIWRKKDRLLRGNAATHAQAKVERAEKDLQLATLDEAKKALDEAKKIADGAQARVERAEMDWKKANEQLAKVGTTDPVATKQATETRDKAQKALDEAKKALDEAKKIADDVKNAPANVEQAEIDLKKANEQLAKVQNALERAKMDWKKANEQLAKVGTTDPVATKQATETRDKAQNALDLAKKALDEAKKIADGAQARVEQAEKDWKKANEQLAKVGTTDPVATKQATETRDKAQNALDLAKKALDEAKKSEGVETLTVTANRTAPWGVFSSLRAATALGSAIRPGEIYRIVHEIADLTKTEAAILDVCPELVDVANRLLGSLAKPDQPAEESKTKLEAIEKIAKIFTTPEQQKAVLDSLANFGTTVERATTEAYDRFQRWFGSAQDRAEQWFQTHVRVVTIVCSICAAFILQLDTAEIYRQLRDQPKLVEALVKSAPGVLEKGGEIVEPSDTPAYHAYLLWLRDHPLFSLTDLPTPADQAHYTEALKKRLAEPPSAEFPLGEFAQAYQAASKVEGAAKPTSAAMAKAAYKYWVEKFPKRKLPPDYDFSKATQDSIKKDIAELLATDPDNKPDTQVLLQDYANLQTQGAYAYQQARKIAFAELQKTLDEAGFDLLPQRFLGRWDKDPTPTWAHAVRLPRSVALFIAHLVGILATAGLLALGAPFWFNLLKNLMSLRPAVATLIEKRPTSAPALPAAPTSPPSPS